MPFPEVGSEALEAFERGFSPQRPEKSVPPASVLGFGEITTVLEIQTEPLRGIACKRMPMFQSEGEIQAFLSVYHRYLHTLGEAIGIQLVPSQTIWVPASGGKRWILYILQERVPVGSIASHAIHLLEEAEVLRLLRAVLDQLAQVFTFNREHAGEIEIGIDGQISNWAIAALAPGGKTLPRSFQLRYFDTSTPLLRLGGVEQLDPELFLRSAPFFLVWILRLLYLDDVMIRYYDFRRVAMDLVANFYKEGLAELVPKLVGEVNRALESHRGSRAFEPMDVREVQRYYREDARIWRLYLAFRKLDRRLRALMGLKYPYVLPDRIDR